VYRGYGLFRCHVWLLRRKLLWIKNSLAKLALLASVAYLLILISVFFKIGPNVIPMLIPVFLYFFISLKEKFIFSSVFLILIFFSGFYIHLIIISLFLIPPIIFYTIAKKMKFLIILFWSILIYNLMINFLNNIFFFIDIKEIHIRIIFNIFYFVFCLIYPIILNIFYNEILKKINLKGVD